jgi:hypothetical protein
MKKNITKVTLTEEELVSVIKNSIKEEVNRRSIINKLYRITSPFTRSKYHDTAWKGVDDIIEALRGSGYEPIVTVKDGGYRNSKGGNTLFVGDSDVSYWKEYDLEIPVEDKIIHGQIKCHAAGSVDDVFSSYDMTCNFW